MPRHNLTIGDNPYPNVTPKMWADGERYVRILCQRFTRKLPSWMDRAGFESAALLALVHTARTYKPERGAWTTPLTIACQHQFQRELTAQMNWVRGAKPTSRTYDGPEGCPLWLDMPMHSDEDGSATFGETLPDERYDPERLTVEWQWVNAAIERLPELHQQVLRDHYWLGRTLEEIGIEHGFSKEWSRQILRRAIYALRRELERAEQSQQLA